jgi:REP element-mobilizing transposase RayT
MPAGYYERRLPHWQPGDAALFVTWHLHGSLPRVPGLLLGSSAGKAFVAMDRELARAATRPRWLKDERIARCVVDALHFGEKQLRLYDLHAWVIMANHAHILISPHVKLSRIMKAVKNFSARQTNEILGRRGEPFWQDESYDHWVRDQREFGKVACYIESNPVVAGLAEQPEDWPWSSATRAGREACPTR